MIDGDGRFLAFSKCPRRGFGLNFEIISSQSYTKTNRLFALDFYRAIVTIYGLLYMASVDSSFFSCLYKTEEVLKQHQIFKISYFHKFY